MAACEPLSYQGGFVTGVLQFVDCQAQNIGAGGYQAMMAPGSTLSLLVTALLTIFVAFYGYRMLMGQTPVLRDGVLALAKVGIVLALVSSWPAYRTLVYDVALHGPAELASGAGGPAGLPGSGGGIVARLQGVDLGLIALARAGLGPIEQRTQVTQTRIVNGQPQTVVEGERATDSFEPTALGWARVIFLTTVLAGFASVRIVAGLLLAIGPFFIALLLFAGTRGLFEGWVRGLAAAALGAVAVTILLGVELALVEPWIAELLARRAARLSIVGAPTELLVTTLVFAVAMLGALAATTRIAIGFRLPDSWREASDRIASTLRSETLPARPAIAGPHVPAEQRSRAAAVAEAVAATQRRELRLAASDGGLVAAAPRSAAPPGLARDLPSTAAVPLGQTNVRRTRNRATGSGTRRDRSA